MVKGVLHQRLEGKLQDSAFLQGFFKGDLIVHDILVAYLLDLEIAFNMADFLAHGDKILSSAEGCAEKF